MSSGAGRSTSRRTPALDHEAAERERPHPHRGPRRAPGRLGQRRRVERRARRAPRAPAATARASFVPDPSPTCGGIASTHAQMRAAREPQRIAAAAREGQRALRVGALDGQLVGRLRLEHDRRAARPTRRARRSAACRRRRPRACPRCRRAGASTRITVTVAHARARTPSPRARAGPPVLSTSTCSRSSSARISVGVEQARPRREDRGLEHRVARPVEAEELATGAAADHVGGDPGTLAPSSIASTRTSRHEHASSRTAPSTFAAGRVGGCGSPSAAWLNSRMSSVRLHDRGRRGAQVAQRPRPAEGLDDDPLLAPLDAHRAAVDAAVGVDRRHDRLDDSPTAPPGSARSPSR